MYVDFLLKTGKKKLKTAYSHAALCNIRCITRGDPAFMPSGKSCRPVKSKHLFHGVIRHP